LVVAIVVIIGLQFLNEYISYKEISWKEFFSDFVEQGKVERLEVIDKRWVRVITKDSSSPVRFLCEGDGD
jgi:hypothetical protein